MQHDPPDSKGDEFSVRLSWPKVVVPPKDEPEPAVPAPKPAATPGGSSPSVTPRAPKTPTAVPPATLRAGANPQRTVVPTDLASGPEGGIANTFVGAFDRLSDRLLDRLRVLRQDVDADLNALRAEVAMLRQAVEDSTHGLQIRQLQTSLDEVRGELAGLRRAVLEWPELERVAEEVSAVRGDLSFLFESAGGAGASAAPSAMLAELRDVTGRLAEEATRLGAEASGGVDGQVAFLIDEVSSIRTELSEISRRLPTSLGDDQRLLDRVADAVTERLLEQLDSGGKRSKRR